MIFGSRDYPFPDLVRARVLRLPPGTTVICGRARGPDTVAEHTAQNAGLLIDPYPADWKTFGRRAGHIRNAEMLEDGRPDIAIGFWDGRSPGTKGMIERCRRKGLPLEIWMSDGGLLQALPLTPGLWELS